MKLDFRDINLYIPPTFQIGGGPLDPDLERRVHRPMIVGSVLVGLFVVGLLIWAALAPLTNAVLAQGSVRVETNRKDIRHLSGGVVRQILVKEGQHVAEGQRVLILDDVQPRAAVNILQGQSDGFSAQLTRYQAEAGGLYELTFPPQLISRANDPSVRVIIRDQTLLFTSRLQFYESQNSILAQRIDQLDAQIAGVQAQIDATNEAIALTQQELSGYQTLFDKGFAPRTLILRYQRSLADLAGRKGQLAAQITQLQEQKGETRIQIVTQRDQRVSQAADGVRQTEAALAELAPRLTAARQVLAETTVKSPADGFVLQLTQFTTGGVIGAGELLMSVVPANSPLVVTVRVKPIDIDDVHIGMKGRIRLTAYNSRKVPPLAATVTAVSADQLSDEKSGANFFRVDLRVDPQELAKLPTGAKILPGMPAQALITTGTSTILHYIVSPITDTISNALHEG